MKKWLNLNVFFISIISNASICFLASCSSVKETIIIDEMTINKGNYINIKNDLPIEPFAIPENYIVSEYKIADGGKSWIDEYSQSFVDILLKNPTDYIYSEIVGSLLNEYDDTIVSNGNPEVEIKIEDLTWIENSYTISCEINIEKHYLKNGDNDEHTVNKHISIVNSSLIYDVKLPDSSLTIGHPALYLSGIVQDSKWHINSGYRFEYLFSLWNVKIIY